MPYSNIDKPSKYFNTVLYTGNGGSSQSITGVGFKPDFVWIKDRPLGFDYNLFDSVRGIYKALFCNTNYVENFGQGSNTDSLTSFDTDGFSVGGDDALNDAYTYASWNWLANGTGVSNTVGTITSTVSANTTSGFSIVSYTGNGNDYPTGATVGHGLGVAPKMIITKSRTESSTNWCVYHKSFISAEYVAILNGTGAPSSGSDSYNRTNPTSTVFSVGQAGGGSRTNGSGATYISYCFAEVKGFSKMGSYIGNGSANGTFVYTGFKPAFILIKRNVDATNWLMYDNKRDSYNVMFKLFQPNTSSAEATADPTVTNIDFLSNGFKLPTTWSGINGSGSTYYYMCFAESPFTSSKGIPTTAR
jgi:hypothetical protein